MNRKPSNAPVTFDLQTSRDMLVKLAWQVDRLIEAKTREVYIAINAALTAWHLHDWVWVAIERSADLRLHFGKEAGISPQKLRKAEFAEWLVKTNPDLAICQVMATSAKHVGFQGGDFTTVASVKSAFASRIDDVPDFDSLISVDALTYREWELKVVVGDKREPVIHLFERIRDFWTATIYNNRIDDSSIGEQPPVL